MKEVNYPLYRRLVGNCDSNHRGTVVEFTGPCEGTVVVPTKGYALGHKSIFWNTHDCPTTWEPVAAPVKRTVQYPNLLVEVFNQEHLDAACNVADKFGYDFNMAYNSDFTDPVGDSITVLHFAGNGHLYKYTIFSKAEALEWPKRAAQNLLGYSDFLGAKFTKLRKVPIAFGELNPNVTQSKDNQSVLAVVPRPKYEVMALNTPVFAQPTEVGIERAARMSENYIAAYGQDTFPKCTCLDVDSNTAKTCRMVQAYGGTCGKPFAKLLKATQEDKDKVIEWYKPKEDVPLVQKLVVWSVLAFSKIVSVVKRGVNFLRGIK